MKRSRIRVAFACLFAGCLYYAVRPTPAQSAQTQAQTKPSQAKAKPSGAPGGGDSEGEIRFEAHCGRCHNPPEDLSPREARAVIRQMRVRAMLSAEDERLILKYIAP